MHTSAFESCRIHHNGGFWDDIYITNMDSTSKPLGEESEIAYTTEKLILAYDLLKEEKPKEVVLYNMKPEREEDGELNRNIMILFSDLEAYIKCIWDNAIREKIDEDEGAISIEVYEKIGALLEIKLEEE